jgi:hypothetical protein
MRSGAWRRAASALGGIGSYLRASMVGRAIIAASTTKRRYNGSAFLMAAAAARRRARVGGGKALQQNVSLGSIVNWRRHITSRHGATATAAASRKQRIVAHNASRHGGAPFRASPVALQRVARIFAHMLAFAFSLFRRAALLALQLAWRGSDSASGSNIGGRATSLVSTSRDAASAASAAV